MLTRFYRLPPGIHLAAVLSSGIALWGALLYPFFS
jgi:hypothetical protein